MSPLGTATAGDVRLSPIHERLWRWLWGCARGRSGAVPRARIHATLEGPGSEAARTFADLSDRAFRKLTEELCAAGYPAWASEEGYYAGETRADLLAYQAYLRKKAMALLRRRRTARWALEAQMARVAGDRPAAQVVALEIPSAPRRRVLVPIGPVRQPVAGQQVLV